MSKYYDNILKLNLDGKLVGNEYKCICPFHIETDPSMSININTGKFVCFGCGEGGDFNRLARLLNVNLGDSNICITEDMLEPNYFHKKYGSKNNKKMVLKQESWNKFTYLSNIEAIKYLASRGIIQGYAELFGARDGRDNEYFDKMIVMPIRDQDGYLISAMGRSYVTNDQAKKTKKVRGSKPKDTLYGFWELIRSGLSFDYNYIIIVEGEMDAISGQQCGYPTVASMGMSFTDKQVVLAGKVGRVILAMDKVADAKIVDKMCDRLNGWVAYAKINMKKYKDLNEALVKGGKDAIDFELEETKTIFGRSIL